MIESAPLLSGASTLIVVDEKSQVGGARRAAIMLGTAHGLGSSALGRLALIVTEAATNIVRHATRGSIVLRAVPGAHMAIEMLALDQGPGIANVQRAMGDGYSTAGTAGAGLGAIRRQANLFELYSPRDRGTALLARVSDLSPEPDAAASSDLLALDDRLGAVSVPMQGERECGDAWRISSTHRRLTLLVVDGLGHGPGAAASAAAATAVFAEVEGAEPGAALARFDRATRGTRGTALSFVSIDPAARTLSFAGVGNVDGRLLSEVGANTTHLVPQNGIVGHTMPTVRPVTVPWPAGARLVLHSDGVSARWRIETYPGLMAAHPSLMAGVLFRDFARERDDATILVLADPATAEPA
jgi:anti-sigma regulatory factor (Ser/Thr protein kinase)